MHAFATRNHPLPVQGYLQNIVAPHLAHIILNSKSQIVWILIDFETSSIFLISSWSHIFLNFQGVSAPGSIFGRL